MQKRKILVTGSNGTVGSYVSSLFPHDELFLTTRKTLDIRDKGSVIQMFDNVRPHIVIHLAAKTNVDECEKDSDDANLVNHLGTENIAKACNKYSSTLVYVSTGAVFNGEKTYFTENDKPNPVNIYGKTKLLGEKAVQEFAKNHIIVRAGWIVGGGSKEKKFISYILQQAREGVKEIKVINDKFGTLTYAKELIAYVKFLLDDSASGIYHFGSLGTCSRYEIAHHLMKQLQINTTVVPVSSTLFEDRFFAPRPTYEVLHSLKLAPSYSSSWQKSLTKYIMNELINE